METTFLNLKTAVDFNAEGQRSRGAEEDEENSVSLSLCDKINTEAQRQRFFFDRINRIYFLTSEYKEQKYFSVYSVYSVVHNLSLRWRIRMR